MCRISFDHARPMPAIARWSRSSGCSRRESAARISRQPLDAEPERLRAEVRELVLRLLGRQQPDAGALLRAGLGEHELPAALEAKAEGGRLRAFLAGAEVAHAAGGHEVDHQHELAVVGLEEEPLAAALRPREAPALERLERRVDRLQRRDVRRAGTLDRKRADGLVERSAEGLDLGQLGHGSSVRWTRRRPRLGPHPGRVPS